ncbi:MAG: hypothetical protein H0U74_12635 [Bradymonadaceae bacterium]|nr:hypothetical protein [Lujinxingiaceae bacterium]
MNYPHDEDDELPAQNSTRVYREGRHRVQRHRFRQMNAIIVGCAIAATMLLLATVTQWLPAYVPLVVYCGGVVLPASLFIVWRSQAENLAVLRTFLLYAALLGLPFLAWNTGIYRGAVFYATAFVLPQTTWLTAFGDRSDSVATLACARVLTEYPGLMPDTVVPALELRPSMAKECLGRIAAEQPALSSSLSRALVKRWYRDLLTSEIVPVGHGCAVADAMAGVATLCQMEGAPLLLNCALASPQAGIASCCAESLVHAYPAGSNPDVSPELLDADIRHALFANLTRVIDRPADALLTGDVSSSAIKWPAAIMWHWAARLGCHLVQDTPSPERIAAELARVTATQCGLEMEDTLYSFETINLIRSTCEPLMNDQWAGQVSLFEWCASARGAARRTAVASASFTVHQGLSAHGFERLAKGIDEGVSARGQRESMFGQMSPERLAQAFGVENSSSDIIAIDRPAWLDLPPNEKEQLAKSYRDGNVSAESAGQDLKRIRRSMGDKDSPHAEHFKAFMKAVDEQNRGDEHSSKTLREMRRERDGQGTP